MVSLFFVHNLINKILSLYSICIIDVVMWPKTDKSNIPMRAVIINSNLLGFYQKKNHFFGGLLLVLVSSSIIWNWHLIWSWHFTQYFKRFKTKSQEVLGANPWICRSYREKHGRVDLFTPIISMVNFIFSCDCQSLRHTKSFRLIYLWVKY